MPAQRSLLLPRHTLALTLALCAALLLSTACDDEEESGNRDALDADALTDASDTSQPDATDTFQNDTTENDTTENDTTDDATDTTGPGTGYLYLRIEDVSSSGDTPDAGADIDAVVVERGTDAFYAMSVEAFEHGGGLSFDVDPSEALGPPDAFGNWQSGDPECSLESGYVSLGGTGGVLIVRMDQALQSGDTLHVLEIGGCTGNAGAEGIPDDFEVSLGTSASLTGSWVLVGSGAGPVLTVNVP